ncbi:hypothetical protein BJX63DRAFT_438808 [Aspergillus granulosus]|uniref:Uncharacterized protein n=1 Tax=Aspergillus granulosus TaxID=176169 RepID=A0ABR4GQZ9_9EURO
MRETADSTCWFAPGPEVLLTGGEAGGTHCTESGDTSVIEERPRDLYEFARSNRACAHEPQEPHVPVHFNEIDPMPAALAPRNPMFVPFEPFPGYSTQLHRMHQPGLAAATYPNMSPGSPSAFWSGMEYCGDEIGLRDNVRNLNQKRNRPPPALEQGITHLEDSNLFN